MYCIQIAIITYILLLQIAYGGPRPAAADPVQRRPAAGPAGQPQHAGCGGRRRRRHRPEPRARRPGDLQPLAGARHHPAPPRADAVVARLGVAEGVAEVPGPESDQRAAGARQVEPQRRAGHRGRRRGFHQQGHRKGTNWVSTNEVTAKHMFFDGLFRWSR